MSTRVIAVIPNNLASIIDASRNSRIDKRPTHEVTQRQRVVDRGHNPAADKEAVREAVVIGKPNDLTAIVYAQDSLPKNRWVAVETDNRGIEIGECAAAVQKTMLFDQTAIVAKVSSYDLTTIIYSGGRRTWGLLLRGVTGSIKIVSDRASAS